MIKLEKKQTIKLSKNDEQFKNIKVCLGWETPDTVNGYEYDLDVSAFCLG